MNDRVLRALRGEPVDRTPVWFMRQAGRYLPEYRAIREKVSFLELIDDPDLACEVTLQPLRRFELDAAIVFSDILTLPRAMGQTLTFAKGMGPRLTEPLRSRADIDRLAQPDVADAFAPIAETLRRFCRARPDMPILGFSGAPFTLLCYMVEGSGSKNWLHPKKLLWSDPQAAQALLNRLADLVGDYLQLQIDAGAAAVQLFDTWAGVLSPEDYRRWAAPAAARALSRVRGAPRVYFSKDSSSLLPWLHETGADAFGLDWRIDIRHARTILGEAPVQGNLDPALLYAPPETIRERVRTILAAAGPVGHIFNLGHGVLPTTPIEGVQAMVDEVRRSGTHP